MTTSVEIRDEQSAKSLYERGLLPNRCDWCPRACGANRAAGYRGVCGAAGTLRVARAALHFWEEPPISGHAGSGAVFFSYCPLRCGYCQNRHIALGDTGAAITFERLVEIFLELQDQGALNLNMVTPTHYAPIIAEAIRVARGEGGDGWGDKKPADGGKRLVLPVAWNTSGYETTGAIESLRGVADIFLTDFKYASEEPARAYSHAPDYPQVATVALERMVDVAGLPEFDEYHGEERLRRGVVVRHLLLPGHLDDSMRVVRMLHERFQDAVLVSIMNQYTPIISPDDPMARAHPDLLRHPSSEEYERLLDYADALGLDDYFWQDGGADRESFVPPFDLTGVL